MCSVTPFLAVEIRERDDGEKDLMFSSANLKRGKNCMISGN